MNSVAVPVPSGNVTSRAAASWISRLLRYALRGGYLVTAAGLGSAAALGLRHSIEMLPVLLSELIWQAVYLANWLPQWSAYQIHVATQGDIRAVLVVVIVVPRIAWRYVFAR